MNEFSDRGSIPLRSTKETGAPFGALVSFIKRRESNGFGSEGDSEGALEKVKGVFTDKP